MLTTNLWNLRGKINNLFLERERNERENEMVEGDEISNN